MSALARYTANVLQKLIFRFGISCYHNADADIGSPKSLHTLFDKYLDHMLVQFEQNPLFQSIQNSELFDKKWFTIFDKALMPFWKTFL